MYLQSSENISEDLENNNNNTNIIKNNTKMEINTTKASNNDRRESTSTDSRAKLCLICKRYTDHATMRCTKYKCHFCGGLGHIPKECPENQKSVNANESSTDQDETTQQSTTRPADPRKFPKRIEEIGKKGSYTFICYTVAAFDSVSKFATSGEKPKAESMKTAE